MGSAVSVYKYEHNISILLSQSYCEECDWYKGQSAHPMAKSRSSATRQLRTHADR